KLKISKWLGSSISWVITGGESGPHARPSSPSCFRSLRKQCKQADVPFHFKQWGDWTPDQEANFPATGKTAQVAQDGTLMFRLDKKGRLNTNNRTCLDDEAVTTGIK